MNHQRSILVVCAFLALMLSGCAMSVTGSTKVQPDSFGEQKRFAIVTIASAKEFMGEKGLSQQFKKSENINGIDTQPVIDQLAPAIHAKFAQTGYYQVVPMKNVVDSNAYRTIPEDERIVKVAFFRQEMNVANGYRYFSDPQNLSRLAQELKVDGVILVTMTFSVEAMKSGFYLGPLSLGKKEYAAVASIGVNAYDREGTLIWKDVSTKHAEPGDKKAIVVMDFTDFAATDFEKMHPSAVLIGEHVVEVIVQRFKDTMEGKKTSPFQRVRDAGTKEVTGTKI